MKAFFCPDQLLHDPQQFMRLGRLHKPTDLPDRAEALRGALAAHGVAVAVPPELGRAPLEAVHSAAYLDFLETAWPRWQALDVPGVQPGPEVLPNLAPYVSGQVGTDRPPCPSPALVAQAGWYLGDLSCPIGPHTWRSVLRSAHSAAAAADAVIAGAAQAYALCSPRATTPTATGPAAFATSTTAPSPPRGCRPPWARWRCWTWTRTTATARRTSSTPGVMC